MKRIIFFLFSTAITAAVGAAGYSVFHAGNSAAGASKYCAPAVQRGDIKLTVNAPGSVRPVQSVQVGSFISGPVQNVFVNFNDRVTAGQMLAQVDPRLFQAAVAREEAALARCQAEFARIKALWTRAVRAENRGKQLQASKAISESEMDLITAERETLDAQIRISEASIRESEANLLSAKTNLEFTNIKSPVDGIVIDRRIDPGQTVASMFQAPALFVIAPELEKRVDIYASVNEDDIIRIREAKQRNEPVNFTVDAYPTEIFEGIISQIRFNPTPVQNAVTYTVVVEASNANLKFLPGMTANLAFEIEKRSGVPIIPNSALQFCPKPEQVRECDRSILESEMVNSPPEVNASNGDQKSGGRTVSTVHGRRHRNHKYVWIPEGDLLSAVPVETGLSDKTYTEVMFSNLSVGQQVVVGMQDTPGN
jgi:HlyD family secretion protein